MTKSEQEHIGSVAMGDSREKACSGADDPEERCPRHPSECTCWQIDPDHPMMKRAAPQPAHGTSATERVENVDVVVTDAMVKAAYRVLVARNGMHVGIESVRLSLEAALATPTPKEESK